jgi:hypothetical protein
VATGFDSVAAVDEQPDSTLLVADPRARTVTWISPTGARRIVVRHGESPLEIDDLGPLLRLPPASALAFDLTRRRFLVIDRSGTAVIVRAWLPPTGPNTLLGQATPVIVDNSGAVLAYALGDRMLRATVSVVRCAIPGAWQCVTVARVPASWLEPPRPPAKQTAFGVVGALPSRGT